MRVYQVIGELQQRKLVLSINKGKRTLYRALSPLQLKNIFSETLTKIELEFTLLESAYRAQDVKPSVFLREGREGLIAVFTDLIATTKREEVFIRISSQTDNKRALSYFPKALRALRDKKGLERLLIASEKGWKSKHVPLTMGLKLIPANVPFDQNVIELVYGNKIALIDLTSETAFVIEGAAIADFHRTVFRLLYQKL